MEDRDHPASAQRKAYDHIRGQILAGALTGGARLNPLLIAEQIGISRMPVREALRQLDTEGLVTIRPNRGAVVTVLTPGEVEELFEMRAALEALAARLALPRLVGEALEELEILCERMDRARGDPKQWIERHNRFHNFLCGQSARPRLAGEIARYRAAVQPYLLMYISVYGLTEMQGYEHAAILDAVRAGSSSLLELSMREHVLSAGRGVIEFLQRRAAEAPRRAARARAPAAGPAPGAEPARLAK